MRRVTARGVLLRGATLSGTQFTRAAAPSAGDAAHAGPLDLAMMVLVMLPWTALTPAVDSLVEMTPILSTTPSHFTLDTALARWRIITLT